MPIYRERLTPPPSWWLGVGVFAAACSWIVLVAVGSRPAIITGMVSGSLAGLALWRYGAQATIVVDEVGLLVGHTRLEARYIGESEALGPEAMRNLHGPQADVRGWLAHRAYIATGVKIQVDDADDPTPYWLVSSRRPTEFKAALDAVGTSAGAEERGNDG